MLLDCCSRSQDSILQFQYLRKMDLSELIEEVYTSTDDEIRETNGKILASSKVEFFYSSLKKN